MRMNRPRRSILITLGALCVLAFCLRLGAVLWLHSWLKPDAMEHRSIAQSIFDGRGFAFADFGYYGPSSFQSPPYPVLLAGLFEVFGRDTPQAFFAAMVINAVAGTATVALTYVLARALRGGEAVGLLAAAAVAVWPAQVYACTVAQAVVLITFSVTAVMVLFYISIRTGKLAPWIAFSLIGTLAALTEPAFLPAIALMGVIILFCKQLPLGTRVRNAGVLLTAALVVLGPWTLRNRRVHGAWVPVKSSFWVNTWKGNNDYASGTDRIALTPDQQAKLSGRLLSATDEEVREKRADGVHAYDILSDDQRKRLTGKSELQREVVFKEITTSWMRAHPTRYAQLCWQRLRKTIWIDWDNPKSYSLVYIISRAVLLSTASIGLLLALRRRWSLGFPALVYCSTLLLYTLTITAARFAIPFEPVMLCLSALTVVTAWQKITGKPDGATEGNWAWEPNQARAWPT
ncbi:MAG: hypothetical protein JWM97_130 [Phycisphaerales bacterium]|nr:hypothetical protein [Phycisphaerales bacterium]